MIRLMMLFGIECVTGITLIIIGLIGMILFLGLTFDRFAKYTTEKEKNDSNAAYIKKLKTEMIVFLILAFVAAGIFMNGWKM